LESLAAKVKALETELQAVKAQLRFWTITDRPRTGADLCGIFAGQMNCSDEDLEEAKYHFEWEGEVMR
jgi:hypothetical protein